MANLFLAEDNPADVFLVREALAAHNIEIDLTVVPDGNAAMKAVEEICADDECDRPGVVMLDINLPLVDGFTVLAALRDHPNCALVPVIIVSSSDSARDRQKAFSLGASHYFRKPPDLNGFLELGGLIGSFLRNPGAVL
jgi:chemotaxis family two-component system response regulator Rcp1